MDPLDKLRADGASAELQDAFASLRARLVAGETGALAESELVAIDSLPDAEALTDRPAPEDVEATAVIKLNGGLGTSMGMTGPKSLLEVRDGLTFLDLAARQVLLVQRREGAPMPLVLMDSFRTREPSVAALARYPGVSADLPPDFLQNRVPKLDAATLEAIDWPADRELEWAPPGHGDLYAALAGSGMLGALLDRGYRTAFVSNADNLGATFDPSILAWMRARAAPFVMEVADRTPADRKGGHLARRADGGALVLREIAQTPEDDLDAFQDVRRHRFFNTNNLWIDLQALDRALRRGPVELPMIVNRKTVDPADAGSRVVVQLETAMGAAVAAFDGAQAIRVPRTRFAPVKTTNDLLALRSDAYVVTGDAEVALAPSRAGRPPLVDLDPACFKALADFEARFAAGAPSLLEADELVVVGDVRFGRDVVVRGAVHVDGPRNVLDGTVLEG